MERAMAVSIRATRPYIRALNAVAEARGMKTADMIRGLVDRELGTEMKPYIDLFANVDHKNGQSTTEEGPGHE